MMSKTILLYFVLQLAGVLLSLRELPLIGKVATQSQTWWNKRAGLAIDGNKSTWSIAASQQNQSIYGWWMVDLGNVYAVSEVRLTSSYEAINSYYLQNFAIKLLSDNGTTTICYEYLSIESIPPAQTMAFPCKVVSFARRVRIERVGGQFRPDAIALAEVQVFLESYYPNHFGKNREYATDVGGYEVTLSGLKTDQSGTWNNLFSDLAVDNNVSTFSVACDACDNTLTHGPGWWRIDLGTDRPIVAVKITSAPEYHDSNYLQDTFIALAPWNTTDIKDTRICYDFNNHSTILPNTVLTFRCNTQPTWGRFLLVQRKPEATFRPDVISIAELKIFETDPTSPVESLNSDKIIPVSSIRATQSSTQGDNEAGLALDENLATSSISLASSVLQYWREIAWWQADLGSSYNITRVEITSSSDETNEGRLNNFSLDVAPASITEDQYLKSAIQCYYYPETQTIPPGTTANFVCKAPSYGRYLIIRKVRVSEVAADTLSLAEVKVYYI